MGGCARETPLSRAARSWADRRLTADEGDNTSRSAGVTRRVSCTSRRSLLPACCFPSCVRLSALALALPIHVSGIFRATHTHRLVCCCVNVALSCLVCPPCTATALRHSLSARQLRLFSAFPSLHCVYTRTRFGCEFREFRASYNGKSTTRPSSIS